MTPSEYKNWILSQDSTCSVSEKGSDTVLLSTDYAEASVRFYEKNIVELTITSKADERIMFYLHFQLGDEEHAKQLFSEMLETLLSMKERTRYRILLTCSSALTTSYFASELNKTAQLMKLDYEFSAVSFSRIYETGFDYDMILLAPQIHHEFEKTSSIFRTQTVMKIPASVFGQYQTGELIAMIIQEKQNRQKREQSEKPHLRSPFENDKRILTMGLINNKDMYRMPYRIYDHGRITLDKEVVKPTFSIDDIFDLMDYIVARHHNIDAISIAFPGITYEGHVWLPLQGLQNTHLGKILSAKYGIPVMFVNDTNAFALGYHALQEESDNIVFYFQPAGLYAGAGALIDGKLVLGRKHAAGEVGASIRFAFDNPDEMLKTPEGTLQLVTAGILSYISALAPEKIILYSALTPDMDALRNELAKYVEPEYIPELIHVDILKTYMMPGALIYALDVFERRKDWIGTVTKH